ncbi:putative Transcriptional repressor of aga operon [Vibrio nigripulchritudo SOn1]|uniref:Transcriptional repressor of aga operon n=1 Tax=Vibrio nigripulchritudo SOn1 TaxID=1238450 RepID=A0AAV2VR96_9VIBR|nr:transcriptional repressor AgaR [Vibrio nigripulchritudo]CCO47217.1 putative Transcriptional repressor of aga operon [Vibrio nigripulchritudo SOn1]
MTETEKRREAILTHIQTHQQGDVNEFAERFNVSKVTIRHDLNCLEKQGCVTRCYGGARLNRQFAFDQPLNDKQQINNRIKSALGAYAANLIQDGDTILLDSGSTTEQIAHHLKGKRNLTVMTNGINIAYHLANQSEVDVMVTGGMLRKNSYSLHGSAGEHLLGGYHFNILFVGVDGFDKDAGISTPHQGEAAINRRMLEAAQTVIAITDSSKFNRQSFCSIARPEEIDMLITDSGIPKDYLESLKAKGVEVRIVDIPKE